jgi:ABC-2 type transport system permease protein
MLRGLWKLTWLELKIFLREPLGVAGTIGIPVIVLIVTGRMVGAPPHGAEAARATQFVGVNLPVFVALLIALSAALSLVTIIAIYRDGGILKRLRATPLRPVTILTAHVLVKLLLTAVTLVLMVLAGKRYYPVPVAVPVSSFMLALLLTTITILSLGFLIASLVPTARFAQPIGSAIFYPMVALSGLFVPVAALPQGFRIIARLLPLTYASSLLKGIWTGDPWSAHVLDVAVLLLMFAAYTLLSAKVFRWE